MAVESTNGNHALAGLWVQALSFADQGDDAGLEAITPEIIHWDREISDAPQFQLELSKAHDELLDIRSEYLLPRSCSG